MFPCRFSGRSLALKTLASFAGAALLLAAAAGSALSQTPSPQAAQTAAPQTASAGSGSQAFTDPACPDATAAGRRLIELIDKSPKLTPEVMATAQDMVAIYQSCSAGFDREFAQSRNAAGGPPARLTSDTLYSHLALARAQQRVGQYFALQQNPGAARAAYDAATKSVDAMAAIEVPTTSASASIDRQLLDKGADLKKDIAVAEAALRAASANGSPAPETPPTGPIQTPGTAAPYSPPNHS